MHRLLGATTAFCLISSRTGPEQARPRDIRTIPRQSDEISLPEREGEPPRAVAEVKRGDLNDTGIIRVKGLKPDLDFDVFTVQRSPLDSGGVLRRHPSRVSDRFGTV